MSNIWSSWCPMNVLTAWESSWGDQAASFSFPSCYSVCVIDWKGNTVYSCIVLPAQIFRKKERILFFWHSRQFPKEKLLGRDTCSVNFKLRPGRDQKLLQTLSSPQLEAASTLE